MSATCRGDELHGVPLRETERSFALPRNERCRWFRFIRNSARPSPQLGFGDAMPRTAIDDVPSAHMLRLVSHATYLQKVLP